MTHRHVRCWLLAAFICAVALAQYDAQPRRPTAISAAHLNATSSTRARPFVRFAVEPRPFEGFPLSQPLRDSIVALALAQMGVPYTIGGTTPRRGFDCSGLVKYVAAQLHMPLPRTAILQSRIGAPIERGRLEPGDIVAFGERDTVSHIGIYIGGGKFVHASSIAGKVIVSPLDRRPTRLIRPMQGARRLLAISDALSHKG